MALPSLRLCKRLMLLSMASTLGLFILGHSFKYIWKQFQLCPLIPEFWVPPFAQEHWPYSLKQDCCQFLDDRSIDDLVGVGNHGELKYVSIKAGDVLCKTVDFLACKLVVVTAATSSHYSESLDSIASIQYWLPDTPIVYYDLGLQDFQVELIKLQKNVEIRKFPFNHYPIHFHVISKYAWKIEIVNLMLKEFEVVYWMDTSIRLRRSPTDTVLPDLSHFPFRGSREKWATSCLTVDGTLKYLNLSREDIGHTLEIEAGHFLFRKTPFIMKHLVEPWVDCAVHEECISPKHAMKPCNFDTIGKLMNDYKSKPFVPHSGNGCHRFEQSALTLLLIREFHITNTVHFTSPMYHTELVIRRPTFCYRDKDFS